MSVAKVLEISASSNKSFEDAIQTGISRVNTSVDQVQGAWIQEQKS
ncbi:dodecin family protein [Brachymonas chironomi]|nr:dodecin family protein [Brachymonas chironomi]